MLKVLKNRTLSEDLEDEIKNSEGSQEDDSYTCEFEDLIFSRNIQVDYSKIFELDLSNCDIDELPSGVQHLNLKRLVLAHNKLKEVPTILYTGLKFLTFLDLSHNLLKNFDVEPACWKSIQVLNLNNNAICNLPQWILVYMCPNLCEILYCHNDLTSLKTDHLLKLKKIVICNSRLIDVDFPFFQRIKTLEYLDISNEAGLKHENRFLDIDKLFFKPKWKHLSVLKLNNLSLSILPEGIYWIESLTELHLVKCDLSWIAKEIQFLTNLEELDVSYNKLCSLPDEMGDLKSLTRIRAPYNEISIMPKVFKGKLQVLDIYNNLLDEFPSPDTVQDTDFLDFECNLCETSYLYEQYKEKKENFREKFKINSRFNGAVAPVGSKFANDRLESYSSLSSYTSEDLDQDECIYRENSSPSTEENWDEVIEICKSSNSSRIKNPDVSPSDDEWEGTDDLSKRNTKKGKPFDDSEDWMFCDAEEK